MKMPSLEKQAIKIDELIAEGRMTEDDLPFLVREGLNQEVVDYWKNQKTNKSLLSKIIDFIIR